MADDNHKVILHQLGAKLQMSENQNPIKLHQLGAEIVSASRISSIIDDGGMLPIFGIVPWKHHHMQGLVASKGESLCLLPVYCYDIFFSLYNVWM